MKIETLKRALILAGVVLVITGIRLGGVLRCEKPGSIWEKIPDEEIQNNIKEAEQEKNMGLNEAVEDGKAVSGSEDRPQAAGQVNEFTPEDAMLLMKIAQAEAANQGIQGMQLVMSVVLNRVESENFPDSIREVIYQEHQFSSVTDGHFDDAVILSAEAHEALSLIECGNVAPGIIGFEVKESKELDKYFAGAFEYRDHKFYTEKLER